MKCKNCVRHVHLNDDGERTIGTPNWCFYLSDSPDEELDRDCKAFKYLTNADRIRAMNDEELASLLMYFADDTDEIEEKDYDAFGNMEWRERMLRWLKQEAKE